MILGEGNFVAMTDGKGGRLLFKEEVALLANVAPSAINSYNAAANRHRREGTVTEFDLPAAHSRVRRSTRKANGQPCVVWTPVWREAEIRQWLTRKRGPGGRVVRGGH